MYTTLEEYQTWIKLYNEVHCNFSVDDLNIKDDKIYSHHTGIRISNQGCLVDNKLPVRFGDVKNFSINDVSIFDMSSLPQNVDSFMLNKCTTLHDVDLSHMKCGNMFKLFDVRFLKNLILPGCKSSVEKHDCYDIIIEGNHKLEVIDFQNISSNETINLCLRQNANTQIFKMFKNVKHIQNYLRTIKH